MWNVLHVCLRDQNDGNTVATGQACKLKIYSHLGDVSEVDWACISYKIAGLVLFFMVCRPSPLRKRHSNTNIIIYFLRYSHRQVSEYLGPEKASSGGEFMYMM